VDQALKDAQIDLFEIVADARKEQARDWLARAFLAEFQ
jgi:hypothetical protein